MMGTKERSPEGAGSRIHFSDDHVRITPRSIDALIDWNPVDILCAIRQVRANTGLYEQFTRSKQKLIARVDNYPECNGPPPFVDDKDIEDWFKFLKFVLMPKEDGFETYRFREVRRLIAEVGRMNFYPIWLTRTGQSNREFRDIQEASWTRLKEARQWCLQCDKVLEHPQLNAWLESSDVDQDELASYSLNRLKEVLRSLKSMVRKTDLLAVILSNRWLHGVLTHHPDWKEYDELDLESLGENQLVRLNNLLGKIEADNGVFLVPSGAVDLNS